MPGKSLLVFQSFPEDQFGWAEEELGCQVSSKKDWNEGKIIGH